MNKEKYQTYCTCLDPHMRMGIQARPYGDGWQARIMYPYPLDHRERTFHGLHRDKAIAKAMEFLREEVQRHRNECQQSNPWEDVDVEGFEVND